MATELPELIAVALRPLFVIGVAAVGYKLAKLFTSPKRAAVAGIGLSTTLFLIELLSIRIEGLRNASAVATLLGVAASVFLYRNKLQR